MLSLYEFEQTKKLMIAAHRGSSGIITENTLAAFANAANSGVNLIELDIQITADNIPIVYHDYYPPGFDRKISQLNYSEIKDIKIGPDSNTGYDSEHIPHLQDVLDIIKDKCYLMIEIKVVTGAKFLENVDKLIGMIIENNYQMNTIFGSFSYDALKKIKEINPSIYTAALKIPGDKRLPSQIKAETGSEAFICSIDEICKEIDEDTLTNNIFTGVYTVDDEVQLRKVFNHNIRAIATNYPDKMIQLIKELGLFNI